MQGASHVQRWRRRMLTHRIRIGRMLARLGLPEYTILTILSIVMGIAAGLAGVGLHKAIEEIHYLCFELIPASASQWPQLIIVFPMIGMGLQYFFTRLAPREAAQKGVLEIIKSVGLHSGFLSFRATLFHFLAPVINIGMGATVGPEAPAAQSGAGVVSVLGRLMGVQNHRLRIFTAAGAGAAIAAVFNTPLAGVFFTLEVILLNDFRAGALTVLILASVAASTVSRVMLGNEPAFHIQAVSIGSYTLFFFYLLLGLVAGWLSVGFIRLNEATRLWFRRLYRKIPPLPVMLAVGLLMGLAGYLVPEILGVGYEAMNEILAAALPTKMVLILLVLKFLLVALILSAGGYGGLFAPSMFIGACLGYLFAWFCITVLHLPLNTTTYTLVGMGAVLAGVNSVPLAAILMLWEMTYDYHFILPLMLGVVGSTLIVQMFLKGSIYARELEHQGYHYAMGKDLRILESMSVGQVMRRNIAQIPENASLAELIELCLQHPHETIFTVDKNGQISGLIHSSTLHHLITEYHDVKGMIIAKDISEPPPAFLKESDTLDYALKVFAETREEELPVLSKRPPYRVIGAVSYQDILNAYNEARVRLDLADELVEEMQSIRPEEVRTVLPGFSLAETAVPHSFVGKKLQNLRIRNRFGVDVLLILHPVGGEAGEATQMERIFPNVNYQFQEADRILVFGRDENVRSFLEYCHSH
ncbi:MAG: CBS domain-containing protein [Calditrichaeota bacterium]|nr:MAG: CBS domain-containing protein [Calditrichota bacterium]